MFVYCMLLARLKLLHRMATYLENLEKSGNLMLLREKSGNYEKSGKLWCATAYGVLPHLR